MLESILTPSLATLLDEVPTPKTYRTPDELDAVMDSWAGMGANIALLGKSRSGRDIRCASFGSGPKTFLAWGYPHPDEPFGGEALAFLGDALGKGKVTDFPDWRFIIILCADPDETARNAPWFKGERDAKTFVRGAWRPTHLGVEVDYGFELEWGPWIPLPSYMKGRCRTRAECLIRCGGGPCKRTAYPRDTLPESKALAEAIERYKPDVVASMHSTHTGGDYTFLLEREKGPVFDDLLAIPGACGRPRHLGEPIDRGHHWRRNTPDLIIEKNLDYFRRKLERRADYAPDKGWIKNHSAGGVVQAQGKKAQFICPESTQFVHPDFDNTAPHEQLERCLISVEDRPKGRYRYVRIEIDGQWVVAEQTKAPTLPLAEPVEQWLPVSRSMLGVRALQARRRALGAADKIWDSLKDQVFLNDHPYMDERWQMSVPGSYVHDGSMLIFRMSETYHRKPTIAQAACFNWRWPLHTASLLGNFQVFLAAQDQERPEIIEAKLKLDKIQDGELGKLPPELRVEGDGAEAIRSQLARCLRLLISHDQTQKEVKANKNNKIKNKKTAASSI
jgi:hypothetical protein